MRVVAWVEVYPWNRLPDLAPMVTQFPPDGHMAPNGKRYRIEFDVPDPVNVDGVVGPDAVKVIPEPEG